MGGSTAASEPQVTRDAPEEAITAALDSVAQRLEALASELRRGSPVALAARLESAEEVNPLDFLITGYALGYAEAARRRESNSSHDDRSVAERTAR